MPYTSLEEALATLSRSLGLVSRRELVALDDAFGRVLARDVLAKEDSPRRDVSHFDGFAIRSDDTLSASIESPAVLTVGGGARTVGVLPRVKVGHGQAAKVLTGGYVPLGADAVVPVEEASTRASGIAVSRRVERGEHVYPAGADVKKGHAVLRACRTLMGQDLALLASLHVQDVLVFKRPRVAIIPTGSELTSKIGDRHSGKVVESHSLLLRHLVEEAGGSAHVLPIVPDERLALSLALRGALKRSEIVLTLAGSSVGEPDIVEPVILGFGKSTTVMIHGIKVNRGRVMGVAVVAAKPVVILPGPIQGALNAFIVFGYPLIRYHLSMGLEHPPTVDAVVTEDWEATGKFKSFDQIVYMTLRRGPGDPTTLMATPASGETEKVSFLVSKNAYALVSGRNPRLTKGERIQAHVLPGFSRLE